MMSADDVSWLFETPIAHRGLHNKQIIENSREAFMHSIEKSFPIEVDIHLCQRGELVVYHDDTLRRIFNLNVKTKELNPDFLTYLKYPGVKSSIMSFGECLELVAGNVPLLIEVKSSRNDRKKISETLQLQLQNYKGRYAFQSFDPILLKEIRALNPDVPIGWLCCNWWQQEIKFLDKVYLNYFGPYSSRKINFLSVEKNLLAKNTMKFLRKYFNIPMLSWTIKGQKEHQAVAKYCDNIIFEGFLP